MDAVEHNEEKLRDITIPFYELEQRVEKMESAFAHYQNDAVDSLGT